MPVATNIHWDTEPLATNLWRWPSNHFLTQSNSPLIKSISLKFREGCGDPVFTEAFYSYCNKKLLQRFIILFLFFSCCCFVQKSSLKSVWYRWWWKSPLTSSIWGTCLPDNLCIWSKQLPVCTDIFVLAGVLLWVICQGWTQAHKKSFTVTVRSANRLGKHKWAREDLVLRELN